jgi:predicted DNA-binding transcriptional regulator AlpA
MPKTFLRLKEVLHRTTLSKVELDTGLVRGTFPLPVSMGVGGMGWRTDDIDAWIKSRPRATDLTALLSGECEEDSDLSVAETDHRLH